MTTVNQTHGVQPQVSRKVSMRSVRSRMGEGIESLVLLFCAFVELTPILWMLSTSLRIPADFYSLPPAFLPTSWHWENYAFVLSSSRLDFVVLFANSLKIAVIVTGAQLLTCSMAGFAFAQLRFPGRGFLFFLFLATMMIPIQVIVVPLFVIMRVLGLIDTHWALIFPAMTSAFGVFLLRQYFSTLPRELLDAAKIDGAGFLRIYWEITLPLVGPGLSALGVLTFLNSWNNFFGPLLFLRSLDKLTLPIELLSWQQEPREGYVGGANSAEVLAAIMLSVLPVLLIFLVSQRFVLKGITLTGIG